MGWTGTALIAIILSAGALALYMIFIEPRWFRTWRVDLPIRSHRSRDEVTLRAGRIPPLRILHVTDTHFGGSDAPKLRFLQRITCESFDYIFLTGDLIETPEGIESCQTFVTELSPRLGTYAVLGGHDYYHNADFMKKYTSLANPSPEPYFDAEKNPTTELRNMLNSHGVEVLADESRDLDLPNGKRIHLIGLRDAFLFNCDYAGAWENVPAESPQIVLAHSPDALDEISERGADLAFFGHTHGGQVRFPLVGAVVTRSNLPTKHARGVFRRDDTIFTLNRGVGAGKGSNFRLLCRPEVTVLNITE